MHRVGWGRVCKGDEKDRTPEYYYNSYLNRIKVPNPTGSNNRPHFTVTTTTCNLLQRHPANHYNLQPPTYKPTLSCIMKSVTRSAPSRPRAIFRVVLSAAIGLSVPDTRPSWERGEEGGEGEKRNG